MKIWRLEGARQAHYGLGTPRGHDDGGDGLYETLRESHGELDLSVEYGRGVEVVGEIAADASVEERWNALAYLELWPTSYAEQEAVREADRVADEEEARG